MSQFKYQSRPVESPAERTTYTVWSHQPVGDSEIIPAIQNPRLERRTISMRHPRHGVPWNFVEIYMDGSDA
jgi:hypothetical protein